MNDSVKISQEARNLVSDCSGEFQKSKDFQKKKSASDLHLCRLPKPGIQSPIA